MLACCAAGGYSTDRAEETIMEAPKVPTLDLKNKRKPPGGAAAPVASDDDDRNLSVIDPGRDFTNTSGAATADVSRRRYF